MMHDMLKCNTIQCPSKDCYKHVFIETRRHIVAVKERLGKLYVAQKRLDLARSTIDEGLQVNTILWSIP